MKYYAIPEGHFWRIVGPNGQSEKTYEKSEAEDIANASYDAYEDGFEEGYAKAKKDGNDGAVDAMRDVLDHLDKGNIDRVRNALRLTINLHSQAGYRGGKIV